MLRDYGSMLSTVCCAITLAVLSIPTSVIAAPPTGKEIAEIKVQGNRVRDTDQIIGLLGIRVGTPYQDERVQEGVNRIYSKGWFTPNGIEVRTIEKPDGTLTVMVFVTELTNFIRDVIYRGAEHISKEELDELSGLRRGMAMSPVLVQQARLNILRKYQDQGRIYTSVEIVEGKKLDDTRVVFDIAESPIVKIEGIDIKFVGKHDSGISTGRLKEQLSISRAKLGGLFGGDFKLQQIDEDVAKLNDYYHGLGYLDARVSRYLEPSDDLRYVRVVFYISEGQRYKVGKVKISGNTTYNEQTLLEYTELREGNWYEKRVIEGDLQRIKNLYGVDGRPINIREEHPEPQRGSGVVHVNYQVQEAPQYRVGEVIINNRNGVTRDSVIRQWILLEPGQVLTFPSIEASRELLERSGLFKVDPMNGIRPTIELLDRGGDSPIKDVLVTVQEAQTGSFMIGAGVNSDAGITGSIVLNERNFDILRFPTSFEDILAGRAFRGGGQEFRLEAVPGNIFQRYSVSWRDPALFQSVYSLGLSGYYFNRAFNEYREDRVGGRATLGRRITGLWTASLTSRIEGVTVRDLPWDVPQSIREDQGFSVLAGIGAGLRRDSRDSYIRPTRGSVFEANYEQIFGDYKYPLLNAEFSNYITTWERLDGTGRHVLAFRSQASYAGDNAPVYERFYAGGFRSIRGFQFRGVGPHENGYNVGGTFSFLNSLEYQIPVVPSDALSVVGFVDSGTVGQSISLRDYRVTAGFGFRISMPQVLGPVPLAIDFGFPIRSGPDDRRQVFSFWIGVAN